MAIDLGKLVHDNRVKDSGDPEVNMLASVSGADLLPQTEEQEEDFIPNPQVEKVEYSPLPDEEVSHEGSRTLECEFVTGAAGTGKTYLIRSRIEDDPEYGVLAATTGIAGVNLGAVTLNSLIGYFDTDSLEEMFINGRLTRKLAQIFQEYGRLIIDEVSMMDGRQLDLLVRAADEAVEYKSVQREAGIILTGDMCQLGPIKAKWPFEADTWGRFEANTTRLTTFWRQSDPEFLRGINLVRAGNGMEGVDALKGTAVEFANGLALQFDGTTIVAKNDQVERFNEVALSKLSGAVITCPSQRWGKLRGEWKLVPEQLRVKVGAYVMILSNSGMQNCGNDTNETFNERGFSFANGDCGHILDYDATAKTFRIKLVRNGATVTVPVITRTNEVKQVDFGENWPKWKASEWMPARKEFKVSDRRRYGIGQIQYSPIRLAYAATVHKTQGLSLDRVQMDVRDAFFGSAGMCYVALSRARTPQGLRIVGDHQMFAKRVKVAEEVRRWL